MARALFMAVHLVNTFVLVALLTLTAHWLCGGAPSGRGARPARRRPGGGRRRAAARRRERRRRAPGDTLYPASTLAEALASDLSSTSHALIRLRVLHPALAIALVALVLAATAHRLPLAAGDRRGRRAARLVAGAAACRSAAGFLNVFLLAPVWMQMVHLLLADVLWIAFVILAASALAAHTGTGARSRDGLRDRHERSRGSLSHDSTCARASHPGD